MSFMPRVKGDMRYEPSSPLRSERHQAVRYDHELGLDLPLTLTSRPIELVPAEGVAPWLTVAEAAAPRLPAADVAVQYANALAAPIVSMTATRTGRRRRVIVSVRCSEA